MMNFQMCSINVMAALLIHASLNSLPLRPVPQQRLLLRQQPLPPQQRAQRQLNVSISKLLYLFPRNIKIITVNFKNAAMKSILFHIIYHYILLYILKRLNYISKYERY